MAKNDQENIYKDVSFIKGATDKMEKLLNELLKFPA